MALYQIPSTPSLRSFTQRVELDGGSYEIRQRWNARSKFWYLDVYDVNGNPLLVGRKLTLDAPILQQHQTREVPPGELVAYDTSVRKAPAGLDELGERVVLLYVEAADLG